MKSRILLLLFWAACLSNSFVNAGKPEVEEEEESEDDEEEDFDFCEDNHDECDAWASLGECFANPKYMNLECQKSCNVCSENGEEIIPPHIRNHRGGDIGVPQQMAFVEDDTREEDIVWLIGKARSYMHNVVPYKFDYGMGELCKNKHAKCAWWALFGECTANPDCKSVTIYISFVAMVMFALFANGPLMDLHRYE
jgi:hypothetical protein